MVFAIGFIQSRKKFCLAYGFMGTFNFGKLGQISRVSDPIAKKADRKTALTILAQSVLLALGLTLATFALPLQYFHCARLSATVGTWKLSFI